MPHYFYTYNISLDDFAVIETTRAEIYLFTMGTPYKINSRTLVLASSGEGFYHSNIPPRSHSDPRPLLLQTNAVLKTVQFHRQRHQLASLVGHQSGLRSSLKRLLIVVLIRFLKVKKMKEIWSKRRAYRSNRNYYFYTYTAFKSVFNALSNTLAADFFIKWWL
jgi:hypothetical protein